nr:hypothetical protein [Tanacetum cinerariifolium]
MYPRCVDDYQKQIQAKLNRAVNQQTSAVTTSMTAILKQFKATPPPASVKSVEKICVTCGDAHPYYQSAVNYNQGNFGYRPPGVANQIRPPGFAQPNVQNNQNRFSQPQGYNRGNNFNQDQSYQALIQQNQVVPLSELEKIKKMNEINIKAMQTQINNVKNELRNEMKTLIQASMSNQTNELKNMMARFFQMNTASTLDSRPLPSNTIAYPKGELKAITTRSGIVLDGPFVLMPPPFINPDEDGRVEETLTDQDLAEYTIKVPPPLVQKANPPSQRNYVVHQRDPPHPNIPYPSRMHKKKQQDKDEIQIHKFWQMFKKLYINITLADALILIPKYQKMLKAPLSNKEKLLEMANTPFNENCSMVILKKLLEKLGDPGKFLILCGFSELKLTLNMRHDTSSYLNQPQKESINMINIYDDSCEDYLEDLFATNHLSGNPTFSFHTDLTSPEVKDDIFNPKGDIVLIEKLLNLDSTKDLPPPHNINPLSSSTTSSSPNHLLEEFADELALITFLPRNDDLSFDIKPDLKEIEYLLNHDPTKEMDSILEDLVDEDNPADPNANLFYTISEMFTDEHALDYSSPSLYDKYDDNLNEFEPSDFLPSLEYDSFLFEDFSNVDALPLTDNEDKVFNPGILIYENLFEVITRVAPDKNVKKIAISHASIILKDFDPPLYELSFHKEVPWSETLLSFSSKNEEKVFKPGILTSEGVHSSLLPELSHRGPLAFKVIKILESPMEIFPCPHGEDICILDVLCLHSIPREQINAGGWVKLSDLKQALHGWKPMLILI